MLYNPFPWASALQVAFASVLAILTHTAVAASPPWLTAHDAEIKAMLEKMSLAEKVGQMTQPDIGSI